MGDCLDKLKTSCLACRACGLRNGCRQVVFGEGDPRAMMMFVGEAPDVEEDRLGRPFVGPAGKLLDRLLAYAGLARAKSYITNVVKTAGEQASHIPGDSGLPPLPA